MRRLILASCVLVLTANLAKGQEITEEQVWKYALLTEVIDQMKADLSSAVNEAIKKQDGMTGARYKELAGGAEPANDFEKQFMANIEKIKERRIEAIKSVNSDLATKMIGGADVYKAVKSAVKSDMKDTYQEFREQIGYGS